MAEPQTPAPAATDSGENATPGGEAGHPRTPHGAARPWHSDPYFMAGVAASIVLALLIATKPWGCKGCKERARIAALGADVDLPDPVIRAAARPAQRPGPGVAVADEAAPSVDEAHAQLAEQLHAEGARLRGEPGPGGRGVAAAHTVAFSGPAALAATGGCVEVEWCGLPAGHDGIHLAPGARALSADELVAAAEN